MPELPEVETIRRQLDRRLPGRAVVRADAHPSAKFNQAPEAVGLRLGHVRRRGKYLIIGAGDREELIIHLGMTGTLTLIDTLPAPVGDPAGPRWRRAWWKLDDGWALAFDDQRRFGRIAVVDCGDYASLPTLAVLGPEPFDAGFTPQVLYDRLYTGRRHIKTALLGQRVVAGIGNIYADEALWRAGINPVTRRLGLARAHALHAALIDVLTVAIDHGGTRLRDYRSLDGDTGAHQWHLDVYGHTGQPCPRCGTILRRRVVDGRGTTWCPHCQAR